MPAAGITVDDRVLKAKLRALGTKANTAVIRASNDAARQTRNAAQRDIGRLLNLPASKIKQKLPVRLATSRFGRAYAEVRGEYEQVGAQSFLGWRYTGRVRGRQINATSRVSRFASARQRSKGLRVRFYRNRPAVIFTRAFLYRGSFFQRVTRKTPRYPIERIVGPSVHGVFVSRFPETVADGRRIFRRRLEYWRDRIAAELRT